MKAYLKYGSIVLMIASLILTGYQMTSGAVLFVFYSDYQTASLYILRGGLASIHLPSAVLSKRAETAVPEA